MWRKIAVFLVFALAVGPVAAVQAAPLPPGFSDSEFLSDTISDPTAMEFAPDGRLFVLSQGGDVRVIKNGALLTTPFVTVPSINSDGERGLLGITFDPDFTTNHFVYLYHTTTTPTLHNRVTRYTANGDVAQVGSEQIIFDLPDLSASNHNGGPLHFGDDGKLYIGVGDNAVAANSQALNTTLGKMLRINADGTIPTNPFDGSTTGTNKAIWAIGLRNPYTFGIDRTNGNIFINDVGQGAWEEIDRGIAGANYGWPATEGDFNQSSFPSFTRPAHAYDHGGEACAITGGEFYRPSSAEFPASYVGKYFFADLCAGWIKYMDANTFQVTPFAASTAGGVVDIDTGPDGNLYYLSRGDRRVHVITYSNTTPSVTIVKPLSTLLYRAGSSIRYSATATDIEQNSIPSSAYSWQVEFIEGANPPIPMTLKHPIGRSGSFKVPTTGSKSTNVKYRFTVMVTDAGGETGTSSVEVSPQLATMTFVSSPAGMSTTLDGIPTASATGVVGMPYTLSAPAHADMLSTTWQFQTWKPGGKITHTLKTPKKDTTYTAKYLERQVLNGSFETMHKLSIRPAKWKLAHLTPLDGRDCVTPADDPICSLHLVGGAKVKTVSQFIGLIGQPGDSYTLNFSTQGLGASASGFTVQLIMLNKDHTTTTDSFELPAGDSGWTSQNLTVVAAQPYKRMQVIITAKPGATGGAWFDSLVLSFN